MKRLRDFLVGILVGVLFCYQAVAWRIGAADAHAQLYESGAVAAYQLLRECQHPAHNWPKRIQ